MQPLYFVIRDSKAQVYHEHIFAARTPGEAERNFHQLVNDKTSLISKYPEDYDLYQIGMFDQTSGKFVALETPQHIVKAIQLVQSVN